MKNNYLCVTNHEQPFTQPPMQESLHDSEQPVLQPPSHPEHSPEPSVELQFSLHTSKHVEKHPPSQAIQVDDDVEPQLSSGATTLLNKSLKKFCII